MTYQQRFRLDGECAVETGGGGAIGLACTQALAEAGARVIVIERAEADAAAALALCKQGYDIDIDRRQGDVTDSARMEAIAAELANAGDPATILINNAGIGHSGVASEDMADDDWPRVMDVNGLFWCSRAFGRHMLRAEKA